MVSTIIFRHRSESIPRRVGVQGPGVPMVCCKPNLPENIRVSTYQNGSEIANLEILEINNQVTDLITDYI